MFLFVRSVCSFFSHLLFYFLLGSLGISIFSVVRGANPEEVDRIKEAKDELETILDKALESFNQGKMVKEDGKPIKAFWKNKKAINQYEKALKLAYDQYPDDFSTRVRRFFFPRRAYFPSEMIGGIYFSLGKVYQERNKYKMAKRNFKDAISFLGKVPDKETEEEKKNRTAKIGQAYVHLADTYRNKKRYAKALKAYQSSLPFVADLSLKAWCFLNMGLCYDEMIGGNRKLQDYKNPLRVQYQGEQLSAYLEAIRLVENEEVDIGYEKFFMLYLHTGIAVYLVAAYFWNDDEIKQWLPESFEQYDQKRLCYGAKYHLERAYDIHQKVFGEKSDEEPQVATLASYLGVIYFHFGEYAKALSYQEKALAIRNKHPYLSKEAAANQKKIEAIREKMAGEEPPLADDQAVLFNQNIQDNSKDEVKSIDEDIKNLSNTDGLQDIPSAAESQSSTSLDDVASNIENDQKEKIEESNREDDKLDNSGSDRENREQKKSDDEADKGEIGDEENMSTQKGEVKENESNSGQSDLENNDLDRENGDQDKDSDSEPDKSKVDNEKNMDTTKKKVGENQHNKGGSDLPNNDMDKVNTNTILEDLAEKSQEKEKSNNHNKVESNNFMTGVAILGVGTALLTVLAMKSKQKSSKNQK